MGIVSIREALARAKEEGLDLVEVGKHDANTSICKIADYGKMKYEKSKKVKKSKQNSKKQVIKEIKFRPNTGDNDLVYRAKQAEEFLKDNNKVKLLVRFRGREVEHIGNTGKTILEKFLKMITVNFKIDENMRMEGKSICILISPG
jgi:translation initiation factor IF-3